MQCYWLCCWLDAAVQDCLCQRGLYLNYAQRLAIALPLACCHDASACQLHGGQCLQACRTSTLHRQCIAICSSMTLVRCCRCQQTKPTQAAQAHCLPCQCIASCCCQLNDVGSMLPLSANQANASCTSTLPALPMHHHLRLNEYNASTVPKASAAQ